MAAALAIISETGIDSLTMRALSDRLDVALGATYKYVANKRILLELVVAELFSRVEDTDVKGSDWQARINSLFLEIYETFRAYPGLAWQITNLPPAATRPPDIYNTLVELLSDAGFTDPSIHDLIRALMFYSTGGLLAPDPEAQDPLMGYAAGLDFLLAGARDHLERSLASSDEDGRHG